MHIDSDIIEGESKISLNCPIRYALTFSVHNIDHFFLPCFICC